MKKISSGIISYLLVIAMLLSVSSSASAITISGLKNHPMAVMDDFNPSYAKKANDFKQSTDVSALRAYLFGKFYDGETSIDISSFKIPSGDLDSLRAFIWNDMIESYHVYSLGASSSGGKLSILYVSYNISLSEYKSSYTASLNTANKFIADLKNSSLSDVNKALLVHDRLVTYCEYALNNSSELKYSMAGPLYLGQAACSGYSRAYKFMLEQLGIQCSLISSSVLNHEWNIVTINGKKYHVDTTWDDPINDRYGNALHNNFLRSTTGIKNTGHNASDFDTTPSSTTYDSYYWQNSSTEFQYKNGTLYYFDNNNKALCKYDSKSTKLLSVDDKWFTAEGLYYTQNFSCLDSDDNSSYLFYSTPDSIYKYTISSGTSSVFYTPSKPAKGFNIYGFKAQDGYFYIDQYSSPAINERSTYSFKYKYASTPSTYTVSYNANGGSVSPSSASVTAGNSVTLPTPTKKYTITYNANGGSGAPSSQSVFLTCRGWAANSSATSASYSCGASFKPTSNTTLWAVWNSSASSTISSTKPSRSGYTFLGWSTSSSATSASYTSGNSFTVSGNTTLYAVWTKSSVAKVNSISILEQASLNYKETITLDTTVNADNGAKYTTQWQSANSKVASVDSQGNLTGNKKWGKSTTTIICTVTDSTGRVFTDTCDVTVGFAWWQWIIEILLFGWIWY